MGTYDIGPVICTHSLRYTGRVLNSGETASFHGADQGESGEVGVGGRPTASPQPKSKGAPGWLNLGGGNAWRGFSCTPGPVLRSEMTLDGLPAGPQSAWVRQLEDNTPWVGVHWSEFKRGLLK